MKLRESLLTALLWVVLVFVTFVSFLSFSVYYSLKWRYSRGGGLETLNPFLVAQLTTTGNHNQA